MKILYFKKPLKKDYYKTLTIYGLMEKHIYYSKNRHAHRDGDLPAAIYYKNSDIVYEWYQNGLIHRENDLPAAIYGDGHQQWYVEGLMHRDNWFPAIVSPTGTKLWYRHGEMIGSNLGHIMYMFFFFKKKILDVIHFISQKIIK